MPGLVAYGHSWIAGDGASRPDRRLVDVAARRLGAMPLNLGVGGSSSTQTAALVLRETPPASRLYLVMTGLNDGRLHGGSAEANEAYGVALKTILDELGRVGPQALILVVEQPDLLDYSLHAPHDQGSDDVIRAYNARMREVVSSRSRVAVVTAPGWDATTMLASDTVHPNDAGHGEIAAAVARAVRHVSGP